MPAPREKNRIDQRLRILESARELFGQRGFEAVTMAEIAKQSGVSRATVFNYFASKHALADVIAENALAFYEAMLDAALADSTTHTATLVRALFAEIGSGIDRALPSHRGVIREIAKLEIGLQEGERTQSAVERTRTRLERLFQRGIDRGEIRWGLEADDLADAFTALANGTITGWLAQDTSGSLSARMHRAADVLLGGFVRRAPDDSEPLPRLLSDEAAAAVLAAQRRAS